MIFYEKRLYIRGMLMCAVNRIFFAHKNANNDVYLLINNERSTSRSM